MITDSIPRNYPASFKLGMVHLGVWSLQRSLNGLGRRRLAEDGDYGPQTKDAVREYQHDAGLDADGICGPATQERLVHSLVRVADGARLVPPGLLRSVVAGESGNLIAAVAWGTPGGVDCGYTQRRVYDSRGWSATQYQRTWPEGASFRRSDIEAAFDSLGQITRLRAGLSERSTAYLQRAGTLSDSGPLAYIRNAEERAWRLAVLHHNYPVAAENYSRYPYHTSSYWTTEQDWVVYADAPQNTKRRNVRFADGTPVRTPFEWCQRYSLGAPEHGDPGTMVRLARF